MLARFDAELGTRPGFGARARLIWLFLMVLIAAASAWAGTFPVFGPERFARALGPRPVLTRAFSVSNPGAQYYLRASMESVSNAQVLLNGTVVIGSADLGRSASAVQKPVQLAKNNVLSVELQSPSSAITIEIYGADDEVPTIDYRLSRSSNAGGWYGSDVVVTFDCADTISGIAGCTAPVTVSSEGPNQIAGVATDLAGNSASTRVTLNVDKSAPVISFSEPAAGSTLSTSPVIVRGQISDAVSQIKAASCNGQAIVVSGGAFSCAVVLSQGENTVRVHATDAADNSASAALILKYAAATAGPAVLILSPATLTAVSAATIDVTGVVKTSNPNSLQVRVNGAPAVLSNTAPAGFNRSFTATGVPLREGQNIVTATASDGGTSTGSIVVTRDTSAPMLAIDTPAEGTVLTEPTTTIAGRVNDVIGPVLNAEVFVSVNGKAAVVRNGSFLAPELPLVPGPNAFTVTASDSAGNTRSATVTVTLRHAAGQRIGAKSGNRQQGSVGSVLPAPLTVLLTDDQGAPVANRDVVFRVLRGDGTFLTTGPERRSLLVATDASGTAQASFRLGSRSGAGNNVVVATAAGFVGTASFVASAEPGPAVGVKVVFGDNQVGVPGQLLPAPLIVATHDAVGNPVPGVAVTYAVVRGGGKLDSQDSVVQTSSNDGRAAAVFGLGTQEGLNNQSVTATIPGLVGFPAVFTASTPAKMPAQLRGLVLDESNRPLSGVTVRILNTSIQASTGSDGQFILTSAPAGKITLEVDGSTAGERPRVSFDVVVQPGQDNALPAPIFLTRLDPATEKAVGGSEVTLSIPNLPSATLTVAANSVTCPGGAPGCDINFVQVHSDQLPLPPPGGITPKLNWSVQPSGVRFDPPARLTLPNTEGLRPGQVVELFSFDYDLGQFVPTGTAMVSDDGAVITSDLGSGIARSGWGFVQSPPTALSCAISCDDGNGCTDDIVTAPCFCEHTPRLGGCEDGLYCTSADGNSPGPDACDPAKGCTGKAIADTVYGRPSFEFAGFRPLIDFLSKLNDVGKKVDQNLPKGAGLSCKYVPGFDPEIGFYTEIYSRCCEDEDSINNGGLKIGGTARLPIAGVECGVILDFKLLTGKLVVGLSGSALLETNTNFSPCASDVTCQMVNSAKGVLEVYVLAEINVLKGFAGASLKGSAAVSIGPKQTCTTLCKLGLVTGDPAGFLLSAIPTDCTTTVEMCFGPLVASGRIKLFGFIKIGFTYRVPNTTWCTSF